MARGGGHFKKERGIIVGGRTSRDDKFITRKLAFDGELALEEPRERIEPMHRARETPERVRPKIATAEVTQFVKQHETPLLMCPVTCFIRQQHRALQKTRRTRHKTRPSQSQPHVSTQTKRALALG